VEPEETADDVDVDEVVDVGTPVEESMFVDVRDSVVESLVVTAELLQGIVSPSNNEM
jgi:hypothetical protein